MDQKKTRLQELHQQVLRKKHVSARIEQLLIQQKELTEKVEIMKAGMLAEQDDVEVLEGRSLARFFYMVVGKLDEKLDKERVEAYASQVRYDAAVRELEAVRTDLRKNQEERTKLEDCEELFFQLYQEKAQNMRDGGSPEAVELIRLEENIVYMENQLREIREAMAAGHDAITLTDKVLKHLDSADGYGMWDLLGGGIIADALKYSEMDQAQEYIELLQVQLRRFRTELADVTIETDISASVGGLLQFADYFFDGLFADWAVLDKIDRSIKQVKTTKAQILTAIRQLEAMEQEVQHDLEMENARRDALVVESDI